MIKVVRSSIRPDCVAVQISVDGEEDAFARRRAVVPSTLALCRVPT